MSLDVFQQVFSLSLISNLVNDEDGTQTDLQAMLQLALTGALPAIGADWKLVWGPVVWKHVTPDDPTTGPDNSWYIAYHPSLEFEDGSVRPTYVIAIAGTPVDASHVWETQNFAVDTVTDFSAWVLQGIETTPVVARDVMPGVSYITTGTVNTVHFMLNTPTPMSAISPSTTLLDFFANLDKSASPTFITTGHSLGGALSPSLALSLVEAGVIPAGNTLTYPSAGPSPGNTTFAELFVKTFPSLKLDGANSYQGWNLNLVNTLDIVPQAWCTTAEISEKQNLFNIPPIFGLPAILLVTGAAGLLALHAASSRVQYAPIPSQYFTGTPPDETPSTLEDFVANAIREHIIAYPNEVGVDLPTIPQLPNSGVSEKTEIEKRFNYPVIAGLEWAREHPKEAEKEIEKEVGTAKA